MTARVSKQQVIENYLDCRAQSPAGSQEQLSYSLMSSLTSWMTVQRKHSQQVLGSDQYIGGQG